mgnify:CR=1 FL=1
MDAEELVAGLDHGHCRADGDGRIEEAVLNVAHHRGGAGGGQSGCNDLVPAETHGLSQRAVEAGVRIHARAAEAVRGRGAGALASVEAVQGRAGKRRERGAVGIHALEAVDRGRGVEAVEAAIVFDRLTSLARIGAVVVVLRAAAHSRGAAHVAVGASRDRRFLALDIASERRAGPAVGRARVGACGAAGGAVAVAGLTRFDALLGLPSLPFKPF